MEKSPPPQQQTPGQESLATMAEALLYACKAAADAKTDRAYLMPALALPMATTASSEDKSSNQHQELLEKLDILNQSVLKTNQALAQTNQAILDLQVSLLAQLKQNQRIVEQLGHHTTTLRYMERLIINEQLGKLMEQDLYQSKTDEVVRNLGQGGSFQVSADDVNRLQQATRKRMGVDLAMKEVPGSYTRAYVVSFPTSIIEVIQDSQKKN